MASFGPALQSERTRRGLSPDDVARELRLPTRYLLALENEDLARLPGEPYNRSYVRSYAAYLALDADSLVRDYEMESRTQIEAGRLDAQPDTLAAMRAVRHRASPTAGRATALTMPRLRGAVLGSLVVVALVGVIWLGARAYTLRSDAAPGGVVSPSLPTTRAETPEPVNNDALSPEPLEEASGEPALSESVTLAASTSPDDLSVADVQASPLSVDGDGVGTAVVDRQLVGESDTFVAGTRVAFWTSVTGGQAGDIVRHVWAHQGRIVSIVELPIEGANWRTYSRQTLFEGDWVVEARDADGSLLARREFRCIPQN